MKTRNILLVYDHQCAVCDAFSRKVRVRDTAGKLNLVNARDPSPVMDEITARGLDIDRGMVLKVDDKLYYGSDAIHELSLMSNAGDAFNWLTYGIFRSRRLSHIFYPILVVGHNLLLKLMGKSKINNLERSGNDRF